MALPALGATGGKDRPYKLSGNQAGWFDTNNGHIDIEGPFIATHTGKGFTRAYDFGAGEVDVYTVANGDQLFAHVENTQFQSAEACPDVPEFFTFAAYTQTMVYDEGTGRFEGARGTAAIAGCLYFGAEIGSGSGVYKFHVTWSETGTLSY